MIYFILQVLLVSLLQCKGYVKISSGRGPIVSKRGAEIGKKQEADAKILYKVYEIELKIRFLN